MWLTFILSTSAKFITTVSEKRYTFQVSIKNIFKKSLKTSPGFLANTKPTKQKFQI